MITTTTPTDQRDQADESDHVEIQPALTEAERELEAQTANMKRFWGPDFCRVEYLAHLVTTGRIHGH